MISCASHFIHRPELYQTKEANVVIDLSKGPSYGRTVCDVNNRFGLKPNATIGLAIDLEKFWDLVEDTIRKHI